MARGRPSRRRQISCTDASASALRITPRAAASSTKSVVASSMESGSSGSTCSVESRSGVRLVARILRSGARSSSRPRGSQRRGEVLEVVEDSSAPVPSRRRRLRRAAAAGRLANAECASDRAGTSSGSDTGASPTRCTGRSMRRVAATSSASLLLPAPPGPVMVTSLRPVARGGASTRRALPLCRRGDGGAPGGRRRERLQRRKLAREGQGRASWNSCAGSGRP